MWTLWPDINFNIIRLASIRSQFESSLFYCMLIYLTRGPLLWRRSQQTPPNDWHLYISVRDPCPTRLVPLWAPTISRVAVIKLGISFVKSRQCSQRNVITWSRYVAWHVTVNARLADCQSIDAPPSWRTERSRREPTKAERRNKEWMICWAAATCSGAPIGVGVLF
jgi:hypothetical protein